MVSVCFTNCFRPSWAQHIIPMHNSRLQQGFTLSLSISVGQFQSDALLVPEHCVFDHIHDSKECKNYEDWNKTSLQACEDRGMTLQSFAILQPCGIDRFNGVEFVCCPEEG